ncbi:MAG: DUF305 domain-containing protein [Janthinobacterium lividum]
MRRLLLAAALPFALVACDGGGDPVAQATQEIAANNHARTVKDGTVSGAEVDHAAMGHDTHGSDGPTEADKLYAEGEAEMHRLMAAASGNTPDEAYINKMIAHHQGAVAMARTALANAKDPQVRQWAQGVIDAQEREIAEMRAWKPAQ